VDGLAANNHPELGRVAPSLFTASVRARSLATFLAALLCLQQLLLWAFLGFSPWIIAGGTIASISLCLSIQKLRPSAEPVNIDLRLIGLCFVVSLFIFMLGGEGRFFYANTDWQVRNAVLHDLVVYPWPFAYAVNGQIDVLRAPLGLYLIPSLVGKFGGLRCAELVMLAQSAVILTAVLALGSSLFETRRERIGTLLIFAGFSGMDILGMAAAGGSLGMHLEGWGPLQYSSHITQAFWVPMHALSGWIGATLYLLWRTNRLPLFAFLTPLPLLALLSPLALIGLVPFAAQAGTATLWSRKLHKADVALPLVSLGLSLPSLAYLASGSSSVGGSVGVINFGKWAMFEGIEVVPYIVAVILLRRQSRFGNFVPLLVSLILLLLPLGQVGASTDLTMRASIPALAILSVLIAEIILRDPIDMQERLMRALVVAALLIGSLTPLTEIMHAVTRPRQPLSSCSYFGVVPAGAPTYVAPLSGLERSIAPEAPTLVRPKDPSTCLEISWFEADRRYSHSLPISFF
jgi:hypothetical protein